MSAVETKCHSWQTPPDIPGREGQLDFRPVANIPSVVFGGVAVPFFLCKGGLRRTIEEVRKRPEVSLYTAIINRAGMRLPASPTPDGLYPMVSALVRLWWYELVTEHGAVDENNEPLLIGVPDTLASDTGRIYLAYLEQLEQREERVSKNAPVRTPRAARREKQALFRLTDTSCNVKGKRKHIYDAAVVVSGSREDKYVPEEALVEEARKQGYTTNYRSYDYSVRWEALQLVKSGHLYVVGDQSEIPGTPKALPR